MRWIEHDVVRVFVDDEGRHGNALGIVDGHLVGPADRQAVAAALGFSETVFVDDAEDGRVQIFTPAMELPFAGHPTVGAAWWLAREGHRVHRLEVPAGQVLVERDGETTRVRARAEWTPTFAWHELASEREVEAADPAQYTSGQHYVWAWTDPEAGGLRSRMFAPAMGIVEDEATGAAAIALTARLGRSLDITQGRGSQVATTWQADGWATVGGRVVLEGHRTVDW
jgi:predicted PhzF superfamily epimerase YddE/YHI9